jgi:hypothetical protein
MSNLYQLSVRGSVLAKVSIAYDMSYNLKLLSSLAVLISSYKLALIKGTFK